MTRVPRVLDADAKSTSRLVLIGTLLLVGLTGGVVACGSLGSPVLSAPPAGSGVPSAAPTASQPRAHPVGDRVRTGNLKVEVTGLDCGLDRVGGEFVEAVAKGQFCLVRLTAENVGQKKATIDGTLQKVYDAQGRSFTSDWDASYAAQEENSVITFIKPGRTAKGVVAFDVPRDVTPQSLRLTADFSVSTILLSLP